MHFPGLTRIRRVSVLPGQRVRLTRDGLGIVDEVEACLIPNLPPDERLWTPTGESHVKAKGPYGATLCP